MSGGGRRQSHEGADRLSLFDGLLCQIARKIRNRFMRNHKYGGVRGRKTKVGRKPLRFPPTRFVCRALRKHVIRMVGLSGD